MKIAEVSISARCFTKKFAKEQGCYNVTLNVWECNPSARKFYEKAGLKPYKTGMEVIL